MAKAQILGIYRTLAGNAIQLDSLPAKDRGLYVTLKKYFDTTPSHVDFSYFWRSEGQQIWGEHARGGEAARREIANSPIFAICQDFDSRVAIREGHLRDYTKDEKKEAKRQQAKRLTLK